MIRILSNYRCRAGCSTSSHGRLPPPYEGLETALVRRQRWPGAVVQKHRDVITVTRVKRQKCIKHADLCGFLRMKKSILYTFFFFFFFGGRFRVIQNGVVALGGRKTMGNPEIFRRTRVQEVQERTAGAPGTAMLSRWAVEHWIYSSSILEKHGVSRKEAIAS